MLGFAAIALAALAAPAAAAAERLDYNRDVRPILSNHCFKCHGPDAKSRKADLRFDIAEPDGGFAFVPGHPERSEAFKRIKSEDPDEQMPPPESAKRLTKEQVAVLEQWVSEGAEYLPHWSFSPPKAAALPAVRLTGWPRNAIDYFVLARLEREGLAPAAEAEKSTLLRRVTLDLTGLPPTLAELDAFLADQTPGAYERVVDRLLASPHHGERMAVDWLDAARYADTNGYFGDLARQSWPWRDWVIQAFNRGMPYDQFTIEQLAGDLLPNPTMEQRIATGFNRNNMTNNESGLIDEEYRIEYVTERLETTSTVWMGMTIGCARCHDHKYDPVSQREYYQLSAFFNNSPEPGLVTTDVPAPVMDVATPDQRAELGKLTDKRRAAEKEFTGIAAGLREPMAAWEKVSAAELAPPEKDLVLHVGFEPEAPGVSERGSVAYDPAGLVGQTVNFDGMQHLEAPAELPLVADRPWSIGLWLKPTGSLSGVLGKIEPAGDRRGFEVVWQKGRFQINLVHRWGSSAIEVITRDAARSGDWQQLVVSYDGSRKAAGVRVYVDGRAVALNTVRDLLDGPIDNREPLRIGRRDSGLGFYGRLDELRLLGRAVDGDEAKAWYWSDRLRGALALESGKRTERQKQYLLDYYVGRHADATARLAHQAVLDARAVESAYREQLPKTLVMEEMPAPRTAYFLKRGKYDDRGEPVSADVPAALPPLPADAPRNRLGLARWLASPAHPLTARVAVNRIWKQCFGEGIVRTINDFGAQGDAPTHRELLDWLAAHFVAEGWRIKPLLKIIVTSATYRQSSIPAPAVQERDPDNRLLARGPRFRLPAEMVRDQALATVGLLVPRLGGPSVKPYQPPGLWEAVTYDGQLAYDQDKGEGLWRRSLYTYWKRQVPPPVMLTFDGPTRETCNVNRARTNTPLQALATLNDVTFVEAGRALGALALAQPGDDENRLRYAFRRATARWPDETEIRVLSRLLGLQRAQFMAHPADARELIAQGESPAGRNLDSIELAAWTTTAHAILNLDEIITRR